MVALAGLAAILLAPAVHAQSEASLSLTKIGPTAPQPLNTAFTYTLNYSCSSLTTNCVGVVITDTLDPLLVQGGGVTLIGDAHTASTSFVNGTATFVMENPLPAGTTGSVAIEVRFPPNTTPVNASVDNSANISADNASPVTSNTVTTTALVTPGVTAGKTLNTSPFVVGLPATYTVTWRNSGNVNLNSPTLIDTLPDGVTCAMVSNISNNSPATTGAPAPSCVDPGPPPAPSASNATITWTMAGPASPSATNNFSQTFQVTYPESFANTPVTNTVDATGIPLGETTPITNDFQITNTPLAPAPNLTLTKSPNGQTQLLNNNITYTVTAHNPGNVPLNNLVVVDTLPAGLTCSSAAPSSGVVSISNNGVCVDAGPPPAPSTTNATVTWTVASLAVGATFAPTVTVIYRNPPFAGGQPVTNTANATATAAVTGANVTVPPAVVTNTLAAPTPGVISVGKSPNGSTFVRGQPVTYTVTVQNSGQPGSGQLTNFTVTDPLQDGLTCANVGTISNSGTCDSTTTPNQITWTFAALNAGATQSMTFVVTYPNTTPLGTVQNCASANGTYQGGTVTPGPFCVTNTLVAPNPLATITKNTNMTTVPVGATFTYTINVQNTGNVPLTGMQVTDNIPLQTQFANVNPNLIVTDTGDGSAGSDTIEYFDSALNAFVTVPNGATGIPSRSCGSGVCNLVLPPTATAIRITYVPRPPGFLGGNPATPGSTITMFLQVPPSAVARSGAEILNGETFQNCADVTSNELAPTTLTACAPTQTITEPTPTMTLGKSLAPGQPTPVPPPSPVSWSLTLAAPASSLAPILNPTVTDCLPQGLDLADPADAGDPANWSTTFTPGPSTVMRLTGAQAIAAGCQSGQIAVVFSWAGADPALSIAPGTSGTMTLNTQLQPGTAPGSLINTAFAIADNHLTPTPNATASIAVANGASLESIKLIKGSLDSAYSKYPTVGQTTFGGSADYRMQIQNTGNVPIDNITAIDILPFVGDTAVLNTADPRLSQWSPILTGQVTDWNGDPLPSDVTVLYSDSTNPCRPELNYNPPGCVMNSFFPTPPNGDLSTVRSLEFQFLGTLAPGDSIQLQWTMVAPANVIPGQVAWNSFGFTGFRTDIPGPNGQLTPAEPNKVGIAIVPYPLQIQKLVNDQAAPTAPGLNIVVGQPVIYTYKVTNPGDLVVTNLDLFDNPAQTITCDVPGVGVVPAADATIAPHSTLICMADAGPAQLGQHSDTACVTGQPVVDGTPGTPTDEVCDTANYNGVQATPAITTSATSTARLSNANLSDTATLTDFATPLSGTVTFTLYGPFASAPTPDQCVPANATTGFVPTTAPISPGGTATLTPAFRVNAPGFYTWVASYSGDVNNQPVTSTCADVGEVTEVVATGPTITTSATPSVTLTPPTNPSIQDTAMLAGFATPLSGTVTFTLFGPFSTPSAGDCILANATPGFASSTVPINPDGTATSAPFTPTAAGTYLWVATYSGGGLNTGVASACGEAGETSTVAKAAPTLTTSATASVTLPGNPINDTAMLAGFQTPLASTGTVTFTLFGPFTSVPTTTDCVPENATPGFTVAAVPINPDGTAASAPFTPTVAGVYLWVASFSGDDNNHAFTTGCGDSGEKSIVNMAGPTMTTSATPSVTLPGNAINDIATLHGAQTPVSGTVTFTLFGPFTSPPTAGDCVPANITAGFTSTPVEINPDGTATSASFTPTAPGTYLWLATYSGDPNDHGFTTGCGDSGETSTVNRAAPTISTSATSTARLSNANLSDTATLHNAQTPVTGDVTFELFGPFSSTPTAGDCIAGNATTGFTPTTVPINPGGTATLTPAFRVNAPGFYAWIASYSGDANNAAVASACADIGEVTDVVATGPTITTSATPSVTLPGHAINDTAALADFATPLSGTVTFTLFGPFSSTPTVDDCIPANATPGFTSTTVTINPDGTATSASFTPTAAGTYLWVATYSGGGLNTGVASVCGESGETSTVNAAAPNLTTSATPSVTLPGNPIQDTAALDGFQTPVSGTVTFTLFGPFTSPPTTTDCVPVNATTGFTSTPVNINPDGTATSASFTPTVAGTYLWVASYSGDDNNRATVTGCGDVGERTVVNRAAPTISTSATSTTRLSNANLTDTAILHGAQTPVTGDVTFELFGPFSSTPTAGDCIAGNATTGFTPTTVPINPGGTATLTPAFRVNAPGFYAWIASYSGDANNVAVASMCADIGEVTDVVATGPTITTSATPSVTLPGHAINDTAALADFATPLSGTVTFTLFGPFSSTPTVDDCIPANATPGFTSTPVTINPDGTATSASFTPTAAGTYLWVATYSGGGLNTAVASVCGESGETSTVARATPTLTTSALTSATLLPPGNTMQDTATLHGAQTPVSGAVTFTLFGPFTSSLTPDDCVEANATTGFTSSTVEVDPDGTATSDPFAPTAAGTYLWVASYSGDTNNAPSTSGCLDTGEMTTVAKATPTITTTPARNGMVGRPLGDTAHVTGFRPTGTATFELFGPSDTTCSLPAVFSDTIPLAADGTAALDTFVPQNVGTYRWIVTYNGDANNNPVSSGCDEEEDFVAPASTAVVTTPSAGGPVGSAISDHLVVTGGVDPTGTISWSLFGPGDPSCSADLLAGNAAFKDVPLANGSAVSPTFTPTRPGTYQWVADYSGDSRNAPARAHCGDPTEQVVITAVGTALPGLPGLPNTGYGGGNGWPLLLGGPIIAGLGGLLLLLGRRRRRRGRAGSC